MSTFNIFNMTSYMAAFTAIFLTIYSSRDTYAMCGRQMLSPIYGQTCNRGQPETLYGVNHQQCTYECLRRGSKCVSLSYNALHELCEMTATRCHELTPHPDAQTIVLHDWTNHPPQCLNWSPCDGASSTRSILSTGRYFRRWLARWRDRQGNLLIGYIEEIFGTRTGYFKYTERRIIRRPLAGCDVVSVAEDCSVAWMPFTIGDPIPRNAAETGYIIGHGPVYVGRFDPGIRGHAFGFYMTGNQPLTIEYGTINIFEILVVV